MEQDQVWARILAHKYLSRVTKEDIPRYPLVGKHTVTWSMLKKGETLIKEGILWICKRGEEALF